MANSSREGRAVRTAIPEIELEKCTGCGDCIGQCPTNAVELVRGKAVIVRPQACNYCTECEPFCLAGAIRCPFDIILVKVESQKPPEKQ